MIIGPKNDRSLVASLSPGMVFRLDEEYFMVAGVEGLNVQVDDDCVLAIRLSDGAVMDLSAGQHVMAFPDAELRLDDK